MKKIFLALLLCIGFLCPMQAAYLENVPRELHQPNGDILHCFVSGDEYYNYIHDEQGFTIVQNHETGYYVYADLIDGKLVPTSYVAGKVNPVSVGLRPRQNISADEWLSKREAMLNAVPVQIRQKSAQAKDKNIGTINNIVIFIRFADDSLFTGNFQDVKQMFVGNATDTTSLYHYYKYTTYNQLFINSYFYPDQNGTTILSYQDILPRRYFLQYDATTNPDGYTDQGVTEHQLLRRAINAVKSQIPASLNLDNDNNGEVDNICFIVQGSTAGWSDLLWPHRYWLFTGEEVFINGKKVNDYMFLLNDNGSYFQTGVICHEMNHVLSAPDLYRYTYPQASDSPVGIWDLMGTTQSNPQQMGAYMKWKYGHWIDPIPEIKDAGTYVLYPINSAKKNNKLCYKIASERSDEYFVLEYRTKKYPYDNFSSTGISAASDGLIIYRINTNFEGNAGDASHPINTEVYAFRPNGYISHSIAEGLRYVDGNISSASFIVGTQRRNFYYRSEDDKSNPYPFYSDGTPCPTIDITVVSRVTDSLVFTLNKSVLAVNDLKTARAGATIFPNPVSGNIHIRLDNMDWLDHTQAELYDLYGRLVKTISINNQVSVMPVNEFSPGLYILKLKNQQAATLQTSKIIIQ
ncbi:MAG: M6 family metalloprotease domain-containing protein [Bacteroidales bacterium]|jgi:M6 family metalloprotease-like protein|nr:M6 family metalloprotease domain-containing protein [Bacteroidales bacterium]